MIELPEARTIARDLEKEIIGKTIVDVGGNFTDHKFTWYLGEPNKYKNYLSGKKITKIIPRNFYVEIEAEDYKIIFRDGANIRYYDNRQDFPEKSKLLLEFNDGSFINVTVGMYGCLGVFKTNDKKDPEYFKYYQIELDGIGVLDKEFTLKHFKELANNNQKQSVKALLATEQKILGIGNGVVQDIMFNAGLNPKRKINTLNEEEIKNLYNITVSTINEIFDKNGRDTEKDIYGNSGGYKTKLSSKSYKNGCPTCQGEIKKEAYLGGSIYYCPDCQN